MGGTGGGDGVWSTVVDVMWVREREEGEISKYCVLSPSLSPLPSPPYLRRGSGVVGAVTVLIRVTWIGVQHNHHKTKIKLIYLNLYEYLLNSLLCKLFLLSVFNISIVSINLFLFSYVRKFIYPSNFPSIYVAAHLYLG